MRFLVFSDLHAHNYQEFAELQDGLNSRFVRHLECLHRIAVDAKEWAAEIILFTGDIFHLKNFVDSSVIRMTMAALREMTEVAPVIVCPGNHDYKSWNKDPVLLEMLADFSKNIFTLTENTLVPFEGWTIRVYPFTRDVEALNETLKQQEPVPNSIGLFHQDVLGMQYGGLKVAKGLDAAMLSTKFTYSFIGHYHGMTKLADNVYIPGSPLMLNFGEADQRKGWLKVHAEKGMSKVFEVENVWSPRFITLELPEGEPIGNKFPDKVLKESYFRIQVHGSTPPPDINRITWKRVSFEGKAASKSRGDLKLADSTGVLVEKYVSLRNTELDKGRLVETGRRYLP